jgi:hypothetical protein
MLLRPSAGFFAVDFRLRTSNSRYSYSTVGGRDVPADPVFLPPEIRDVYDGIHPPAGVWLACVRGTADDNTPQDRVLS